MALVDIIRGGVKIAAKTFESVKTDVTFKAWTGATGFGVNTFAAAVPLRAIVDRTVKQRYTTSGKLVIVRASLVFLDPIADTATIPVGGVSPYRAQPIDPRDVIILSDGVTYPILSDGGVEDSGTSRPFLNEVVLGEVA